jgi:two-component sensor histidine kinase
MASPPTEDDTDPSTQATYPACTTSCNLLAETDHRTANHFALLSSYARLRGGELERADQVTPELVRIFTRGLDAHIAAIAQLHRILAVHKRGEPLELAAVLQEVCGSFARGFADRVSLIQELAPASLVQPNEILPISQIVVEAMTNALKYGCKDSPATLIVRSWTEARSTVVEILNHGPAPATPEVAQIKDGLGLRLMRAHARTLRGAISFDRTPNGFRVRLVLPEPEAA